MSKFVSNTSPILYLSKIGLIDNIYLPPENFLIPNGVKEEILAGAVDDYAKEWIGSPNNKIQILTVPTRSEILAWDLGKGETEVLSYLLSNEGTIGIIDDLNARRCAHIYHLPVIGTIGLLLNSKGKNQISSLKETFTKLKEAGFYIDKNLLERLLIEVKEL